ncbi:hypothetical protein NEF87_001272 [Candidatus Lokiarchaeum ossiferum]|uniref:Major facilitator superfamily (MFS) profile domain-containing protein n=1 Tax=Candidatus Lokiarchaeum ossiferum TaxID=2951803 RepID=A0ABY6HNB3_9ARCH|nr:hypothetical protein NEF87_001272 [Candidatus Lokiarchaeum sp. B-35]
MDIIPPIKVFSKSQWASIFGANIVAALLWASHFVFEYFACFRAGLPLHYVLFAYMGCVIGGIFALLVVSKLNFFMSYILLVIFDIIFVSLLQLVESPILLELALFGSGFCGSAFAGLMFSQLIVAFPDPKYNGRANALGYLTINFFIIAFNIFILLELYWMNVLILAILGFVTIFLVLKGRTQSTSSFQSRVNFGIYFQAEGSIMRILIAIFWGFFLTLPFYFSFLLLESRQFSHKYPQFMLILFVTVLLSSIPNGILLDTIGRRIVMLLGLGMQAFAFILLYFTSNPAFLYTIFPIILGVGITMFLTSNSLLLIEISLKKFIRDSMSIAYILMGIGMLLAVGVGELLHPKMASEPAHFIIILLFLFLIAAILISQVNETLPTKGELEWKGALQYISIMYKSGITIFTQDFTENDTKDTENRQDLLGGAIVAVNSIMKEVAQNKMPLKVLKQEDFTILVEDGRDVLVVAIALSDIKKIRRKMQEFLESFEEQYGELLKKQISNVKRFDSASCLVSAYFQHYW